VRVKTDFYKKQLTENTINYEGHNQISSFAVVQARIPSQDPILSEHKPEKRILIYSQSVALYEDENGNLETLELVNLPTTVSLRDLLMQELHEAIFDFDDYPERKEDIKALADELRAIASEIEALG